MAEQKPCFVPFFMPHIRDALTNAWGFSAITTLFHEPTPESTRLLAYLNNVNVESVALWAEQSTLIFANVKNKLVDGTYEYKWLDADHVILADKIKKWMTDVLDNWKTEFENRVKLWEPGWERYMKQWEHANVVTPLAKEIANNIFNSPGRFIDEVKWASDFIRSATTKASMEIIGKANTDFQKTYSKDVAKFNQDFNAAMRQDELNTYMSLATQWWKPWLGIKNPIVQATVNAIRSLTKFTTWAFNVAFKWPQAWLQYLSYIIRWMAQDTILGWINPKYVKSAMQAVGITEEWMLWMLDFWIDQWIKSLKDVRLYYNRLMKFNKTAPEYLYKVWKDAQDRIVKNIWEWFRSSFVKNSFNALSEFPRSWLTNLWDNFALRLNMIKAMEKAFKSRKLAGRSAENINEILNWPETPEKTFVRWTLTAEYIDWLKETIWFVPGQAENMSKFSRWVIHQHFGYNQAWSMNMIADIFNRALWPIYDALRLCTRNIFGLSTLPTVEVREWMKSPLNEQFQKVWTTLKADKTLTDAERQETFNKIFGEGGWPKTKTATEWPEVPKTAQPWHQPFIDLMGNEQFLTAWHTLIYTYLMSSIVERNTDPQYNKKSTRDKWLAAFQWLMNLHQWIAAWISNVYTRMFETELGDTVNHPNGPLVKAMLMDFWNRFWQNIDRQFKFISDSTTIAHDLVKWSVDEDGLNKTATDIIFEAFNKSAMYYSSRLPAIMYGDKWLDIWSSYWFYNMMTATQMDPDMQKIQQAMSDKTMTTAMSNNDYKMFIPKFIKSTYDTIANWSQVNGTWYGFKKAIDENKTINNLYQNGDWNSMINNIPGIQNRYEFTNKIFSFISQMVPSQWVLWMDYGTDWKEDTNQFWTDILWNTAFGHSDLNTDKTVAALQQRANTTNLPQADMLKKEQIMTNVVKWVGNLPDPGAVKWAAMLVASAINNEYTEAKYQLWKGKWISAWENFAIQQALLIEHGKILTTMLPLMKQTTDNYIQQAPEFANYKDHAKSFADNVTLEEATMKVALADKDYSVYDIANSLWKYLYKINNSVDRVAELITINDMIKSSSLPTNVQHNIMCGVLLPNGSWINDLFDNANTWRYDVITEGKDTDKFIRANTGMLSRCVDIIYSTNKYIDHLDSVNKE